jgi:hypothetical protein
MVEFDIKLVETPESAPDRARLVKNLTEGQISVPDDASEEANYKVIEKLAQECEHFTAWFGEATVYIWPMVLGPDPVIAFRGVE